MKLILEIFLGIIMLGIVAFIFFSILSTTDFNDDEGWLG